MGSHGTTPGLPATPVKYEYGEPGAGAVAPGNAFTGAVEGAVGPKPPEMKYSCSLEFARHHSGTVHSTCRSGYILNICDGGCFRDRNISC